MLRIPSFFRVLSSSYPKSCTLHLQSIRCSSSLPDFTRLTLPALSPTMEAGTISKWEIKEGEAFAEGDVLAEVETDKATVSWEVVGEEGYIAKIFAADGTKNVKVGDIVAVYVSDEGHIQAFSNVSVKDVAGTSEQLPSAISTPQPAPVAAAPGTTPAASTSYPAHNLITLPALSPTMNEGTLQEWMIKVGDTIEEGAEVAMIETDKAVAAFELLEEGIVAKLLVPGGAKGIPVGAPVLILVDSVDKIDAFKDYVPSQLGSTPQPPETPANIPPPPIETQPVTSSKPVDSSERIKISPLGKKMLLAENIALAQVQEHGVTGSGPGGRIRQEDVTSFIAKLKSGQLKKQTTPTVPIPQIVPQQQQQYVTERQPSAEWALESKQTIPHYYLTVDIPVDNIDSMCAELNSMQKDTEITRTDFILKAVGKACQNVPDANSEWLVESNVIRQYLGVNIETNNAHIANVESIGLKAISQKSSTRDAGMPTFSVYNFMDSSVDSTSAIIKPGQACALTIGGARKEIIPDENDLPKVATMIQCTLSCDHRLVDGAVGATWLQEFKNCLKNPISMLL